MVAPRWTVFKARAPGLNHSCQDAAEAVLLDGRIGIALVADGHGSKRHFRSGQGASLGVAVAQRAITQFIEFLDRKKIIFWEEGTAEKLKQLERNIIYCWREAVLGDLKTSPLTEEERLICTENHINQEDPNDLVSIYGTTLLGAAVAEGFWFAIQIGDGACVILTKEGKAEIGIPQDERLEFGRTTSLCNADALDSFRHNFGDSLAGITLASDGVTDSFIPEKYTDFNMHLLKNFIAYPDQAEKHLQEFLPKLSERGSNDDVSMAGIFDLAQGKQILDTIQEAGMADPAEYGDYCTSAQR